MSVKIADSTPKRSPTRIAIIVGRSLVYGSLAVLIVGIFLGIHWLISRRPTDAGLEIPVDIATALLMGFSLKALAHRLTAAVDSLFLRQRRQGDGKFENIITALWKAETHAQRMQILVAELPNAFGLASAAIFERTDDGGYVREAAVGWPAGTTWHLLPDDPVIRKITGTRDAARLGEDFSSDHDLPTGPAEPAIGFSIQGRREPGTLIFYGACGNGSTLDRDEVAALQRIVQAAKDAQAPAVRTSIIQRAAIILCSVIVVSCNIPPFFAFATWGPGGDFGVEHDYSGTITSVDPGGAAALAGLRVGDRIDLDVMPSEYQRDVDFGISFSPGKISEWQIMRGGKTFVARLVSQPVPKQLDAVLVHLRERAIGILCVVIGSILLLRRPSKMTLGFYLFCVSVPVYYFWFLFLHWEWAVVAHTLAYILQTVGAVGFLIFSLRFPRDIATGWKRRIDESAPFIYLGAATVAVTDSISRRTFSAPENTAWEITMYALFGAAAVALLSTFLGSFAKAKKPLRWAIVGIILGSAAVPLDTFVWVHQPGAPDWLFLITDLLSAATPIAAAYGVFRYQLGNAVPAQATPAAAMRMARK